MKKHIYMLLMIVVYAATSLAQVEAGDWYRIKHIESGTYMSTENYEPHTWEPAGGVKCVEYAESDNQIFTFIPEGTNYRVMSKSGYYIYCQEWNVDALADQYTELYLEETHDGYLIKNMTYDYSGYYTYFSVAKLDDGIGVLPAGAGYYPFGNQPIGNASTFVFESVEIAPLRTITVSANNSDWGTVSGGVTAKNDITITATAKVGYKFINWTLDGEVVSTTSTYVDMTAGDKHYVANFEPLLQLEVGKWYRIKDIASQTYLSAESYDAHPEGSAGGVKSVEYTDVANQIFTLEAEGENYKLKCISGYYVYCQAWNVDALKEHYTPVSFEVTAGGYYIKNMRDNTYFKVGYIEYQDWMGDILLPAGDGYYAFGDGGYGDPHNTIFNFESVDVATLRTITVESNNPEWGTVTGGTIADRAIIIEATPTYGYKLVNWSVDGDPVGETLTYVDYTSGDKHYVANFDVRLIFDVSVNSANHSQGLVEATQTGGVMEQEEVTFTANPRYGYRFVNWTTVNGDIVSTKNPYTLTITEPVELVANFKEIPEMVHIVEGKWYRIRDIETGTYMSAENYDAHTDGPGGGVKCVDYAADDDQIFRFEKDGEYWKVISRSGYSLYCQKWNIDAQEEQYTPLQFIATSDNACFIKNTAKGTYFKVEYIINYYWEAIPLPAGEGYYPFGDSNPDLGMPISKFALESADAAPWRRITVSANNDEWGKVTGAKADGTTIEGEGDIIIEGEGDITMEATPSEDYRFVNWTLNDSIVSTKPIYIDHTAGNKHYVANFEKLPEIVPIEVGKKYRIMDLNTGLYLSAENYEAHPAGEGGGVKCVEYADSDNQIFMFVEDGDNYKLKSESGYYIYCQRSNVDALSDQHTPLSLIETLGGYYIRDMIDLKYFRVEYLASHTWDEFPPPAGDGYYPFGDAEIGDTHTAVWVLVPVETTPMRTISASVIVAEGGSVSINEENVSWITADDFITLQAIENEGYRFVSWTLNDSIVSTTPTYVDMTAGDKHYIANIQPFSAVRALRTTHGVSRVKIKTDADAIIKVCGEEYSTIEAHFGVEVMVPETVEDDITIETIGANLISVDLGANLLPIEIPETVTEIALRNVEADDIELHVGVNKVIVVSNAEDQAVNISPSSDFSQGVQLVVEKEINTPKTIEIEGKQSTPTIFNFISMPFDFNTAEIRYWDGNSWEYITPEKQIRFLMYDSQIRANNDYDNTWRTLQSAENIDVPANVGFVIVGNKNLGETIKLQFKSAPDAYNGSETTVTAYRYRGENGFTYKNDADWNIHGVPYMTNGKFIGNYTLYTYDNVKRGWRDHTPAEGLPIMSPYSSVMYQAEMGDVQSKEIAIEPISIVSRTKSSDDVYARAYISIDDTNPAKIFLSDESSENFVVNEDAWYMPSLTNTTAAAYFNIQGANAKVSVQPVANELPMTIYTGAGTQHRIALTTTDGNYDVYLKDAVTDEVVCLNDEDYTFTASAETTIANRFTISMVEPTGIINATKTDNTIKAVVLDNEIRLYGTKAGSLITTYTPNGMIIANTVAEEGVTSILTSAKGVLIIKVADQTFKVVK